VIDLREMNIVSVDPVGRTAIVAGGAYAATHQLGKPGPQVADAPLNRQLRRR
jgi:hypothetical protein